MSDTSGRSWLTPSAYYDPDESCWKTSGAMFPSAWPTSSQTCPGWGMTRRGELYELLTPALPTAEPASSSLLPTPTTQEGYGDQVREGGPTLRQATLRHLLPTPAVNDMGEGKTVEAWDEWTAKMQAKHGNGNGHGPSLAIEAQRLLPTPTTSDTNGAGAHGDGGADLRTAVSLLPTPRATDGTKGGPNQRGSSGDLMLPSVVMTLLPTPTSQSAKHAADDRGPGTLDDFNLWSVAARVSNGALTRPPSLDGSTSPDDGLPDLLRLDG